MVVLLAAGAIAPAPAPAQGAPQESVAEAARKARAQKKAPVKPVRVYTEEELAKEKAAQEGEPAAISTVGAEQQKTTTEGKETAKEAGKSGGEADKKEGDNQEQKWRERFKGARENLERAEKELDILQREAAKASLQKYSDPNQAMREQFERKEINDKNAKIEEKTKEIAQFRQALSDLEDELRKAGGDPSWAR
jgi:chromosome segregation ATPase